MGQHIIDEINGFESFKYDQHSKKIVNKRFQEDTNIDEFLAIQFLLDNKKVKYSFEKNFNIQVIS